MNYFKFGVVEEHKKGLSVELADPQSNGFGSSSGLFSQSPWSLLKVLSNR
jgi:hypothetical protein